MKRGYWSIVAIVLGMSYCTFGIYFLSDIPIWVLWFGCVPIGMLVNEVRMKVGMNVLANKAEKEKDNSEQ